MVILLLGFRRHLDGDMSFAAICIDFQLGALPAEVEPETFDILQTNGIGYHAIVSESAYKEEAPLMP